MANRISPRMVKAFAKFNADLAEFYNYSETDTLYEDAYTTRKVHGFVLFLNGTLRWEEDGKTEREKMFDDDEARDWLGFWRACLRRAKKYFSMDSETLDRIQDGEAEDIEIED